MDTYTNKPTESLAIKYNTAEAKKEWQKYYDTAKQNMAKRKLRDSKLDLIEIAAQHPLKNGITPDTAFEQRLKTGISLYNELKANGRNAKIYIPGSLHIGDDVSLSSAGIKYLKDSGAVDTDDILDESVNDLYKNNEGVYNSADECYVASKIFSDGEYTNLYCICSANQMMRKKLFYFRFGIIPQIYTVPDDNFHDDMYEIFEGVPDVIFGDHDWQDEKSYHYNRTRIERMRGFEPKN